MRNIYSLKNGITVVSEYIGYVHSVSLGVFVKGGSRAEDRGLAGISHMIEHMLFKGTKKRSAQDIAEEIDMVGGNLNAYTTKEYTCYYVKALDSHLDLAADVLSDMLMQSRLDTADIDLERRVVTEEIYMCDDTPEDLVHDMIMQAAWGSQSGLGDSVIGTVDTLSRMDQTTLRTYISENYTANNIVISVVGNFDNGNLRNILEEYFGEWQTASKDVHFAGEVYAGGAEFAVRDIQQAHVCLGFKSYAAQDDNSYSLMAFNNIFGGGMSSALFQKVREEKGLVYSIYSYLNMFVDTGMFVISASMSPENVREVLDIVYSEIDIAKNETLSDKMLYKAKEQLKGNYILGLESTSSRMQGMGRAQLLHGKARTPEENISIIENISAQTMRRAIDETFNYDNLTIAAIGSLESEEKDYYLNG